MHRIRCSVPAACSLLILSLFISSASAAPAPAPRKPNILLILADDLGREVINSYGGTSYKTPNIDALAKSGTRFTQAFATPLCSPSRVELMTGRYGFRTGWINLIGRGEAGEVNDYFDPLKEATFGQVMKNAGYRTALAGKWQLCEFPQHPGHLAECGFEQSLCWAWQIDGKAMSRYWAPVLWSGQDGLQKLPADKYGDDLFSDFLIAFMKQHRDEPFFAYYPMALVHAPHIAPPGTPRAAAAIEAAAGNRKGRGKNAKKKSPSSTPSTPSPAATGDDDTIINDPANFPDMVAYTDRMVGKMVTAVDALGLRDRTLIIFTGDNGTDRRLTSLLGAISVPGGKGTVTELGTHVPLIASWPGTTPAGKTNSDLINFCDVLPTLAELGGAKLPAGKTLDGHSFAPQIQGQAGHPRDWAFTQLGHKRYARTAQYLLHEDGRLYDIPHDLFETNNLATASDPAITAAKKQLQQVLDKCQ